MTDRSYRVITVSEDKSNKFEIKAIRDLTEQEAKTYIRVAVQNNGFGVLMSRVFPSAYPSFTKVTKKVCNDYITAMESQNFKTMVKAYEKLEKIGLKVSVNF